MRTLSGETEQTASVEKKTQTKLQTFSTTLSDGREITIREMTGRDLLFMEKELAKLGDVERGMKLIEKLIVGDDKITYEEILDLGVKDFKRLSDLVAKASGTEDESDPN
jgi:hypothetical protein